MGAYGLLAGDEDGREIKKVLYRRGKIAIREVSAQLHSNTQAKGSFLGVPPSGLGETATILQPEESEDIANELDRCIGLVARVWSRLELVLRVLLQEQSGVEWAILVRLTAGMTIDNVLDAVGSLLEMEGDRVRTDRFKAARVKVNALKGQRNRAIHSTWVWGADGHSAMDVLSRRSRDGIQPNAFKGGSTDLKALADEIQSCVVEMSWLIRDPDLPRPEV